MTLSRQPARAREASARGIRALVLGTVLGTCSLALYGCAPLLVGGAAATTEAVATDRRTAGEQVEDQAIEMKTGAEIRKAFEGNENVRVVATSYAGLVLLTGDVPSEADKQKARYAITATPDKSALSYRLSDMFDGNKMYVNTPHSKVVFAKQGGVGRYYHGGALPQEVVVPIVNFKSSRTSTARDRVGITYVGISLKITNTITRLRFLQSEPVSADRIAGRYKAWFEDAQGAKISDEVTIIADSTDKDASALALFVVFGLPASVFDCLNRSGDTIDDEVIHFLLVFGVDIIRRAERVRMRFIRRHFATDACG